MAGLTYVDAVGAMKDWINSRAATLVGVGHPLQQGAYLNHPKVAAPVAYAYLEEQFSTRSIDSPESPDMAAALSAQVYGGTREAATLAAVALAEELNTQLCGRPVIVGTTILQVADDIQGPSWVPDGDVPRLLINFTVRMRPV
jgi:hypothetical protein